MLTEIPVHETTQQSEFITPLSAYAQYQQIGGHLSMRAWVEAQNTGIDFQTLRAKFPPQGQDPESQYLQLGGNINPELFYQVNPRAFQLYEAYNPQNPHFYEYLRPALSLDTPVPAKPDPLLTTLEKLNLKPPTEVSYIYSRLETLDSSLPAVGSPTQIHVEFGQITTLQKLLDSARMASALSCRNEFVAYAREITTAMEIPLSMEPWNLTDIQLRIEIYLMQGEREKAEQLRSTFS